MVDSAVLWRPHKQQAESSAMQALLRQQGIDSYPRLHQWSVDNPAQFWAAAAPLLGLHFSSAPDSTLVQPGDMLSARWFSGATLNYAEHLLRRTGEDAALIFFGESGERREVSWDQLRAQVAACAAGLRSSGVEIGDRVCGILPNCPEAIIAMLATASIGAVWSSCSPDFGSRGIVDRFGQIGPKVLFCADGYVYNGKQIELSGLVDEVMAGVDSIETAVNVPFAGLGWKKQAAGVVSWEAFLLPAAAPEFATLPFDHPLFVLYSSGTTGVPKCIVHGAGGTLLQHLKEHQLHTDIRPGDRLFYFTTCGWMMWNWLAGALASGATLILFDGSPFAADGRALWTMAEAERVTHFGTSARYLAAQEKAGIRPQQEFRLENLRTILSTGSPLAPTSFDYVYRDVASDVQLSSIAGGTDIISCFALGNPLLPVRRGELQCLGLGMSVEICADNGERLASGTGELVCTKAFPSMPVGFWNDPDRRAYRAAYFERFDGIWAHGDYAQRTAAHGLIIHGRSDAVLNPAGVRIGTAEIYRQVEKVDEVLDSVAIGQRWNGDERIVLFVALRDGVQLDQALESHIRQTIRSNTSPRHVPAKILEVPDIPRTISGKVVEIAVRSVVHGEPVKNRDALANPEALAHFADRAELQTS